MQKYSIFVGIDLSKKWFDAALCIQGKLKQMPHRRFAHSQAGYRSLLKWVSGQVQKSQAQGRWVFCMEHTGVYSLPLCGFLKSQGQAYVLENPLRIRRSLGLRRGKSDKADAKAIAEYGWRFQHELPNRRPLPSELLLRVQALLSLRFRLVRYRQGLQTASTELREFAPHSVSQAVCEHSAIVADTAKHCIRAIMKQICQSFKEDKQLDELYQLIQSVIGVGPVVAAYLIVHTNGFTAFRAARPFACHIGIAPFDQESGSSLQLPPAVSQIANHRLKVLLSNSAVVAAKYDPQIKAFFARQLKKGREDGWIYNAIKNKIVHRVFAVAKRKTPFVKLEH